MANTLKLHRNGAVGFIDSLGLRLHMRTATRPHAEYKIKEKRSDGNIEYRRAEKPNRTRPHAMLVWNPGVGLSRRPTDELVCYVAQGRRKYEPGSEEDNEQQTSTQ